MTKIVDGVNTAGKGFSEMVSFAMAHALYMISDILRNAVFTIRISQFPTVGLRVLLFNLCFDTHFIPSLCR